MVSAVKTMKYTHLPLGKDVETFAGYYTPEQEVRLEFVGRQVLYVTGHVVVESACAIGGNCTAQNFWYATVIGYIIGWQSETRKDGLPVTAIELIRNADAQHSIREIILKNESVARVDFW